MLPDPVGLGGRDLHHPGKEQGLPGCSPRPGLQGFIENAFVGRVLVDENEAVGCLQQDVSVLGLAEVREILKAISAFPRRRGAPGDRRGRARGLGRRRPPGAGGRIRGQQRRFGGARGWDCGGGGAFGCYLFCHSLFLLDCSAPNFVSCTCT